VVYTSILPRPRTRELVCRCPERLVWKSWSETWTGDVPLAHGETRLCLTLAANAGLPQRPSSRFISPQMKIGEDNLYTT